MHRYLRCCDMTGASCATQRTSTNSPYRREANSCKNSLYHQSNWNTLLLYLGLPSFKLNGRQISWGNCIVLVRWKIENSSKLRYAHIGLGFIASLRMYRLTQDQHYLDVNDDIGLNIGHRYVSLCESVSIYLTDAAVYAKCRIKHFDIPYISAIMKSRFSAAKVGQLFITAVTRAIS